MTLLPSRYCRYRVSPRSFFFFFCIFVASPMTRMAFFLFFFFFYRGDNWADNGVSAACAGAKRWGAFTSALLLLRMCATLVKEFLKNDSGYRRRKSTRRRWLFLKGDRSCAYAWHSRFFCRSDLLGSLVATMSVPHLLLGGVATGPRIVGRRTTPPISREFRFIFILFFCTPAQSCRQEVAVLVASCNDA